MLLNQHCINNYNCYRLLTELNTLLYFRSEALQLETTVNCTILKTYEIIKDTTKDAFNLCKKKNTLYGQW